jgi:hypothetical protein
VISFWLEDKVFHASQQTTPPVVYLDQWALIDISQRQSEAERFAGILKERNGTLALSWINLMEFGKAKQGTPAAVDALLEKIHPNFAFLESLPDLVIEREDLNLKGGGPVAPHLAGDFLREFVMTGKSGLDPLSPAGFVSGLIDSERSGALDERWRELVDGVSPRFQEARDRYMTDPGFRSRMSAMPKGCLLPAPTRYVNQLAFQDAISGSWKLTSTHHWADYFHTIVPISYCDYVLLDDAWAARAQRFQDQLRRAELVREGASVFCPGALPQFWAAFAL